MADVLLKETLRGKISVEDIINWLTTDDIENSKWDNINKFQSTQCEFLLYFLNFLRDQTKSILQGSYNTRQPATKAIQPQVTSNDITSNEIEKTPRRVSLLNISSRQKPESRINHVYSVSKAEDTQSSQSQAQNKIYSILSKKEISPISQSCADEMKKRISPSVEANAICELQSLINSHNKTPDKLDSQRDFSAGFNISPNTTTSTPKIDKNLLTKSRIFYNSNTASGLPTDQNFQPSSQSGVSVLSESCIRNLENLKSANENFDSSNCLTISKSQNFSKSNSRNSSSVDNSLIFDPSNEWHNLNSSAKSKNSTINESHGYNNLMFANGAPESPIPPLLMNYPPTPQNSKLSYSRSVDRCQNSRISPQHIVDNTSKQGSHNVQRNQKSTPRQSASLGDFISIDTRGSKKNSARKTNSRIQTSRNSESDSSFTERLSVTEESFPEISTNPGRRKRRIKPTKLDVSDGKGSEASTFGVISRPQSANPQFMETSATDKSDTMPFETERDLLRLERQRQQKKSTFSPTIENTVPNITLKPSNVRKLGEPLPTPSLECVENRQALDILAKIYSSLIDYNLVLNPMTELYFVISVITLQYSFESDKNQMNLDQNCREQRNSTVEEKSLDEAVVTPESDKSFIDKSEGRVNIEFFNEELGCKVLNDDIVSTIDKNVSSTEFDNLTKSSSLDLREPSSENNSQSTKEKDKINVSDEEYFQTIHNCIYFSTNLLNTQRVLISLLDRATVKLLSENNQIATFLPDLQEYLNECYKIKLNESSRLKHHYNAFSLTEANVSFQIETDNHENFPSIGGFQSFRKQRDLFYEALRIWEVHHSLSGFNFSVALAGKVKKLLSLHNDAANYCHFARLFKSQLLLSCTENGPQEEPLDDESLSFLKPLKHLDPEKFSRLHKRLVTSISSRGPVPPPSFPGVQEFYKDFILHAANPMFYAHLQDCLVHEIMELNDTQFTRSEIEDSETMVDEETKVNFITCISSLRLLAKVLGFLVSLPYRCETISVESVLATQLELRSQVLPPLNLQSCLRNAIANGKLALTIPWVVKYLAMLDPVSLRLPYYRTVLEMLCYIYCESKHNSDLENPLSLQVVILLKFSIGWLFELCHFPERLYFNCRMSEFHQKLKSISNFSTKNIQSSLTIDVEPSSKLNQSVNSGPCTDTLDIVNERTLYVCCPFLTELKSLLIADHSNLNKNTTSRHITPVSSGFDKPFSSTSTKQLQLQLEEAFFHGQPGSTRKTVDFVSERVASSCVKHICNSVLPLARKDNLLKFQKIISKHKLPADVNKFKSQMSTEMNSIASDLSSKLKPQCESDILVMCESRTRKSIESLLAEDTLSPVKEMCSQIAVRMAMERVNHWIQSHITGGSLFIKDMEMEIDKIYKNKNVSVQFEKRIHNVNAASPTDVMLVLRSMIWDLLDNKTESVTLEEVLKCLDNTYEALTERADLLPGPEKVIGTISVDFALFLAAHRTHIFVPEVQDKLIKIWKMECLDLLERDSILYRILSPRNIMVLATPRNPNVWKPLGGFIKRMLQERVLSIEALSDQCTTLLRYEWPVEMLKHISTCLAEAIKDLQSSNEESEKMKLLLEWITETCSEMEFISD